MSLFATFETLALLPEGGSFVVGQGSPGMGTSRGKIHGICLFGKASLPLLFGGLLIGVPWIEILPSSKIRLVGYVLAVLMDGPFNPVVQSLVVSSWFESNHGFLQPLGKSLEVSVTDHASLFVVSCKLSQLLELGCVFIQLSSLHSEFEELLLGPFSAHDILEILGEIIDHRVPDPFICLPSSCVKMSIQLCGDLFDPKVHLGSPKVPEKEHSPGHWVVHDPSLFVDPMVYAPARHEFFHLVSISCENFRFLSYHLVQ